MEYSAQIEATALYDESSLVLETNISKLFKGGQIAGLIAYYNSNVSPEYFVDKTVFNENATMAGVGLDFSSPIGKNLYFNAKLIYDLSANEAIRANKVMASLFYKFLDKKGMPV